MKFTLVERKTEVPGIESFIFKPESPVVWKAGQYFHYTLAHEADDRGTERWFTVSAAPFEGNPMITTRHASEKSSSFKEKLFAMKPGDTIDADGIEGEFTVEDASKSYVFLAGGIGITPFHAILKQADHDGVKLNITMLYANRDANVPFKNELDGFAKKNLDLKIMYLTNPERIDEQSIRKYVSDISQPIFYLSGPAQMVMSLAEVVEKLGVSKDHIRLDDFPGYPAD